MAVSRYTLVQVFSKYGNISKLDFLFHKAGPMKGKPRGYAFIEYATQDVRAQFYVRFGLSLIPGFLVYIAYVRMHNERILVSLRTRSPGLELVIAVYD